MDLTPKYLNANEVTEIWSVYYRQLIGRTDKSHYDKSGCLLHWIFEYSRMNQCAILYICYEAGKKAVALV